MGKSVSSTKQPYIPLRILNVKKSCSLTKEAEVIKLPNHLKTLSENSGDELSKHKKDKLLALLSNYQDIFSKSPTDIGKLVKHKIDTGNSRPICQLPKRIPFAKRDEVNKDLADMKTMGVIEPSDSPWCSPIVFSEKKMAL